MLERLGVVADLAGKHSLALYAIPLEASPVHSKSPSIDPTIPFVTRAVRGGQAISRRSSISVEVLSFCNERLSICRMRSRVTLNVRPTSSRVRGCSPSRP
jgi:hypothetical protein